jgi:hypothetical protein
MSIYTSLDHALPRCCFCIVSLQRYRKYKHSRNLLLFHCESEAAHTNRGVQLETPRQQ